LLLLLFIHAHVGRALFQHMLFVLLIRRLTITAKISDAGEFDK
jgi:hypothetical protein